MKFNPNQRYTRWSIRRLSVGVASVVVASGFFVLTGQPASVRADQVNPTAMPVVQTEKDMPKEVKKTSEMPEEATELPMDSKKEVGTTEAPAKEEMPVETKTTEPETAKKMEETSKAEVTEMPKSGAETPEMTPVPKGESPATKEEMATSTDQVKKAVADNVKDSTDVPASYLEKANVPGPFLAGVNQVIPYEAFGGDGMLTRLLLKASDKAPWSDNGTAGNAAILPLEGLAKGQYFYEVDLNGNTSGKEGQALLDQLRANGTQTYQATVKVYGAKDGKPDLTNVVATRMIDVNLNGTVSTDQVKKAVADNVKDSTDVPASYLEKANVPGPFLAGVNQVIPYEAFGGDGMLTRLLLKAADKAPWSDNGTAGNAAILPLEGLAKGQYFYEVDLNGNTRGKEGQALLDQLRANGTQTYQATVKVYGAKDGKPDLTNVVAIRQIMIQLHGKDMTTKSSQDNQAGMDAEKDMKSEMMGMTHGMENMKADQPGQSQKVEQMMKGDKGMLPNTGEVKSNTATIGIFGLVLAGALSLLGVKAKRDN